MSRNDRLARGIRGLALAVGLTALAGCDQYPPVESVQQGYRGTGMASIDDPEALAARRASAVAPTPLPAVPGGGPKAGDVYQNVQVLKDLDVAQFGRLMASMTAWIAPDKGCTYCHAAGNFADDSLYTKTVARRMIQMTQHLNSTWSAHVGETGVTCYTCHGGQHIPVNTWARDAGPSRRSHVAGNRAGQNAPARGVGYTSLPFDPFERYLRNANNIQVNAPQALPTKPKHTADIMDAEHTYGLMMHMSEGLGVNCTFCHNSRAFANWEESRPQRVTAWHGIRMVRSANENYIQPLAGVFPPNRLGPQGDPLKVNCATCHQGLNKPLNGAQMVKDFPELAAAEGGHIVRRYAQ